MKKGRTKIINKLSRNRTTLNIVYIICFTIIIWTTFAIFNNIMTSRIKIEGLMTCNSGEININLHEEFRSEDELKSECMRNCKQSLYIEEPTKNRYENCFEDCLVYIKKEEYKFDLSGIKNIECTINGKMDFPLIANKIVIT